MKLRILGDGLEAWTLAAALASSGCEVDIQAYALPTPATTPDVAEPDLLQLLAEQYQQRRLRLRPTTDDDDGTPPYRLLIDARADVSQTDRGHDLLCYQQSLQRTSPAAAGIYALVQPVPVGTTDQLQNAITNLCTLGNTDVHCLFWPLFIEAGRALDSFIHNRRLLIGGHDSESIACIRQLLQPFHRGQATFLSMPPREAELTKLGINGMLATRVSFMNELAALAAQLGVDIEPVRQGMGADPRIGPHYLYPGCGFGGDAFVQTLSYLSHEFEGGSCDTPQQASGSSLLRSVCAINQQQKDLLFQKFWRYFKADIRGRTVALWGCAFKPDTPSIASSPALTLIEALSAHQVTIRVFDPMAMGTLQQALGGQHASHVHFCDSPEEAAINSDAVFLVTEWQRFWNLDLQNIASSMRTPLLLDGRNVFDPDVAQQAGLIYSGIGRGLTL